MTKKAKTRLRFFLFIVSLGTMTVAAKATPHASHKSKNPFSDSTFAKDLSFKGIDTRYRASLERLKQQAASLRSYININNYNSEYCFLVDMSLPSGKKRFFIYNLRTDAIIESALVTHGIGSKVQGSDEELKFSNEASSLATSLGRYKIGASYKGNFGLSYKLQGLDNTNSRAMERNVVIHAHSSIPTTETYPILIGESFGCPSVAPSFLTTLTKYIKGSEKPVIMWIYK